MEYDGLKAGQEIRRLRNRKRMSILDLSGKLEVSASHINQIELGSRKMSIDLLYKIMEVLDADANTLLAVPTKADLADGVSIDAQLKRFSVDKQRYLVGIFQQMIENFPI